MQTPEIADPRQSAVLFAEKMNALGYNLDFSLDSLYEEIDKILSSPMFADHRDPVQQRDVASLEAYAGETLSRLFDGEWRGEFRQDHPGVNYYTSFIMFGEYRFCPSMLISYFPNTPDYNFRERLENYLPAIKDRQREF